MTEILYSTNYQWVITIAFQIKGCIYELIKKFISLMAFTYALSQAVQLRSSVLTAIDFYSCAKFGKIRPCGEYISFFIYTSF